MGAEEVWDILDADRRPTGRTMRRKAAFSPGDFHLAVEVWIKTADGRFVIGLRPPHKKPFPDLWAPLGGCALSGESSLEAAIREAGEEAGIPLAGLPARRIHSFRNDPFHHFLDSWLFSLSVDEPPLRPQEREVVELRLATAGEIRELINHDAFVPECEPCFRLLLAASEAWVGRG